MQRLPNHSPTRSGGGGFTLVELLVSTAVLSLLLMMLAQVSSMLGNTWSSGNGRAERRQSGRALVDFIGQELRSAALPVDLLSDGTKPDLQLLVNPTTVGAAYQQPHALFWQAPMASDTSRGDMAIIGYFIRWEPAVGTEPPKSRLCRVFLNPGDPNHLIYSSVNNWINDAILDAAAPADYGSGYKGLFADNVIGFWVRCLDQQGNRISQSSVASGAYDSRVAYTGQTTDAAGAVVAKTYPPPVLPDSIEISMVLLDSRAAAQLTAAHMSVVQSVAATSVQQDELPPASKFMQTLQNNSLMKRIIPGMSAHSARIYLENAP